MTVEHTGLSSVHVPAHSEISRRRRKVTAGARASRRWRWCSWTSSDGCGGRRAGCGSRRGWHGGGGRRGSRRRRGDLYGAHHSVSAVRRAHVVDSADIGGLESVAKCEGSRNRCSVEARRWSDCAGARGFGDRVRVTARPGPAHNVSHG